MAVARVQYTHDYASRPTSLAFGSSVTAGSLLICFYGGLDQTGGPYTCSDNNGNTWSLLAQGQETTNNRGTFAVYYTWNANAGATTVTPLGVSNDRGITLWEYSGVQTSSDPLDVSGTSIGTTDDPKNISLTTTADGFIFGCWGQEYGGTAYVAPNAGFTEIQYDSGHYDGSFEKLNTTAGSYTPGIDVTTTQGTYCMAAAGFKAAGGGGTSPWYMVFV